MANALAFLIDAIASIVLFFFLMRLLLQLSRADFRNPIARGMMQLTNWLILPLRKILPPLGRFDTASFLAVLLIAATGVALKFLVLGGMLPPPDAWVLVTLREIASNVLWIYMISILIGVVISWVAPDGYSPAHGIVYAINEPVLSPIRRVLPTIGGFDFSAFAALILIQFLRILLRL